MAVSPDIPESMVDQLDREKRTVSYDAYDITIRQLVDMAGNAMIDIAPDYQRHFIWKEDRESGLIESIFLGIPVPSLFMAANKDGSWEVVDGVQRLSSLMHFCGDAKLVKMVGRKEPLRLSNLVRLSAFNGYTFSDLPLSLQTQFTLRPMRITTLNDKSDLEVRYALFERLNTGGVKLHPQEIRNSVFRGAINGQIKMLARNKDLRAVAVVKAGERTEADYEDFVVRFFALFNNYRKFDHLVTSFLNGFMAEYNSKGIPVNQISLFEKTMCFVRTDLPSGILRGKGSITPVNLYEAISVGTALALLKNNDPKKGVLATLLDKPELTKLSQGGTNTKAKVVGRIELVRDALV